MENCLFNIVVSNLNGQRKLSFSLLPGKLQTTNGKFVHVKFSDKHEQKQQRKHNLSIKVTFIQYLTYIKVISVYDLFVYTTTGAFTKANPHHYLQDRLFARNLFGCHLCVSHLLSTNQRARINLSFVKTAMVLDQNCSLTLVKFWLTILKYHSWY